MTSQVEGTNDSSCLSKLSAVTRNYFEDDFLSSFVAKCPRRAPLIHLGYSIRAAIVNCLMDEFVSRNFKKQVVSLGAGFDTLFFKSKSKNPELNAVYYELDLLRVVKRKIDCIKRSEKLTKLIGQYSVSEDKLIGSDYCLLAVDLRDIAAVKGLLAEQGLDSELPTLFLSECAITYLEEERSTGLIQFASEFLNATFVTYEQIHPDDTFGQVMVNHFASLNSPLQSVDCYPTLINQKQRYISHGWQHCTVLSALDAYERVTSVEERRRVLSLEQFDEWEEFYLKCCHYTVIIASQGALSQWSTVCLPGQSIQGFKHRPTFKWDLMDCEREMRYAHSVFSFKSYLMLFGGFGVRKDGTHGRLKCGVTLCCEASAWKVQGELDSFENDEFMFSTFTEFDDKSIIIYGGRTAPNRCVWKIPKKARISQNDEELVDIGIEMEDLTSSYNSPARWRHTAVIGRRNASRTFIVFGGRTSNLELLNDTWMLSLEEGPSKRTVESLPNADTQPCPRFSHSAVVRKTVSGDEEMWVCGGMSEEGPLSDVWCLDLNSGKWSEIRMPALLPRFGHTACLINDSMVLVGGVNQLDNQQPGVAVVHLGSLACIEYQLPIMDPQKSLLLVNHCLVISKDEKELLIVGGGGNCFSFGTFFNKHIAKIKVKDLL